MQGDDDQAIHRWTGVDVRLFLGCGREPTRYLHRVIGYQCRFMRCLNTIVQRIHQRQEKDFIPHRASGSVNFHMTRELDFSTQDLGR